MTIESIVISLLLLLCVYQLSRMNSYLKEIHLDIGDIQINTNINKDSLYLLNQNLEVLERRIDTVIDKLDNLKN